MTDEKQEIYFAWPKSATVSPVLHGTGTICKPQFHQTKRIHIHDTVKSVAQITFSLNLVICLDHGVLTCMVPQGRPYILERNGMERNATLKHGTDQEI